MKDIKPIKESSYSSDEAIFSAQYRRKLFIKHFLLTKRGGGLVLFMAILYYFGLLHAYVAIFFIILIVAFYLKNKDLSYERDKTIWLLIVRKKFIELLEKEKLEDEERRAKGDFINDFISESKNKKGVLND